MKALRAQDGRLVILIKLARKVFSAPISPAEDHPTNG